MYREIEERKERPTGERGRKAERGEREREGGRKGKGGREGGRVGERGERRKRLGIEGIERERGEEREKGHREKEEGSISGHTCVSVALDRHPCCLPSHRHSYSSAVASLHSSVGPALAGYHLIKVWTERYEGGGVCVRVCGVCVCVVCACVWCVCVCV